MGIVYNGAMIQHTCTGQRSNLGRFARPGNVAAWDRYADVRNNPLRYTDPSGHCTGDPNDPSDPDVECWEKLRTLNKMYDGIFFYKFTMVI